MTEFIVWCILGIVGAVGLLWITFEIGRYAGGREIMKMLDDCDMQEDDDE